MPVPRAFKTDESFLEKIAMGVAGTRRVFEDLLRLGHRPIELERGSMSYKIWKEIKIKRFRVPDILCLSCARRVESRAKRKLELSMSHSRSDPERGWYYGLKDQDWIAFVGCERTGPGPLDWSASGLVQYVPVSEMLAAWRSNAAIEGRRKGAEEGFEMRVVWPAAIASAALAVEEVGPDVIRCRRTTDRRRVSVRLRRNGKVLKPLVRPGQEVKANQVVASVVFVTTQWDCVPKVDVETYIELARSASLSDRYTGVKALGQFGVEAAINALLERVQDEREHICIRVDAAAGLMRRGHEAGGQFLASALNDDFLGNRLEAVIALGEVGTRDAAELLIRTVTDAEQHPEIRAGAAWALGEIGTEDTVPVLVESFMSLHWRLKIEAARALVKVARKRLGDVLKIFPGASREQRPGIAWALSKAGGFSISQLLPILVDDDARHWVAYIIGTQGGGVMLPGIEVLASRDPEVYFAATVLWKIMASWVYDLEEY